MTQIEQRMYALVISACRQYLDDHNEPNWEQRRYEIAKECAANGMPIETSVATADALIRELKKQKEG